MTNKDIIIEDVINNLKGSTNLVIQAQDLNKAEHFTVFDGTINEYKRRYGKTALDLMSITVAMFTDKNTVTIVFKVTISLLKECLKVY